MDKTERKESSYYLERSSKQTPFLGRITTSSSLTHSPIQLIAIARSHIHGHKLISTRQCHSTNHRVRSSISTKHSPTTLIVCVCIQSHEMPPASPERSIAATMTGRCDSVSDANQCNESISRPPTSVHTV